MLIGVGWGVFALEVKRPDDRGHSLDAETPDLSARVERSCDRDTHCCHRCSEPARKSLTKREGCGGAGPLTPSLFLWRLVIETHPHTPECHSNCSDVWMEGLLPVCSWWKSFNMKSSTCNKLSSYFLSSCLSFFKLCTVDSLRKPFVVSGHKTSTFRFILTRFVLGSGSDWNQTEKVL